jgi:hypothetical protein
MSAAETLPAKAGNGNGSHQHVATAAGSDADDFLMQAAQNPAIDADKLRLLIETRLNVMERQREWRRQDDAEQARLAYFAAHPAMQKELPVIGRDARNDQASSRYARYETIWEECSPIWTKHGFAVSYSTDLLDNGLIRTVLKLTHRGGHFETFNTADSPADTAGAKGTVNKTVVQGNQSTATYQKRALLCAALGIATRYDDDDGQSSPRAPAQQQRGAGQPPPPRQQTQAQPPKQSAWVREALGYFSSQPAGWRWVNAVMERVSGAPTTEDIDQLALAIKATVDGAPATTQTDIKVAFQNARQRLRKPAGFEACLLDHGGEPETGEVFTMPMAWARAFVALWERTFPPDRESLAYHNADALETVRQYPEPAAVLAEVLSTEAERIGTDTAAPGSLWAAPVEPPPGRGGPDWRKWPFLIADNIVSVPGFDLAIWLEVQRPLFTAAPFAERFTAIRHVAKAFAENGLTMPAWLSDLMVSDTSDGQAKTSDAASDKPAPAPATTAWALAMIDSIAALGSDLSARASFNELVTAIRPHMAALRQAAPAEFDRLNHAATEKNKLLPTEA